MGREITERMLHYLGRSKAAAQQAITHQLPHPLTVQHVALASRHNPDVAGVDQVNKGIQYTPVDSIATAVMAHWRSYRTRRSRSAVKAGNPCTGSVSWSAGTATKWLVVLMLMLQALGLAMLKLAALARLRIGLALYAGEASGDFLTVLGIVRSFGTRVQRCALRGINVLNAQSLERDGQGKPIGCHEPHQCQRHNPTTLTYGSKMHQWLAGHVWHAQ